MNDEELTEEADRELFAALREMWTDADPVPAGLTERMIAAVAVDDLARDFEVLTLLSDGGAAVRASGTRQTLHFGGGGSSVLLHVAPTKTGERRVDGWSNPPVLAARLAQEAREREWSAEAAGDGRFTFDDVSPGRSRVRMVVQHPQGFCEVVTPWFDI